MQRRMFLLALGACLIAPPVFAANENPKKKTVKKKKVAKKKPVPETKEHIAGKLDEFARIQVRNLNKNLRPNKTHIQADKTENGYCAWYMHIDESTLKTELREKAVGNTVKYFGHILYIEHRLESFGATKKEALNGVFREKKTRRKRELVRYDKGKWRY